MIYGRKRSVLQHVSALDFFSSFDDLRTKITEFEKTNYIQLTHRNSRTLEAARKRAPKKVTKANKELQYFNIHLACCFGGEKYKLEVYVMVYKNDTTAI